MKSSKVKKVLKIFGITIGIILALLLLGVAAVVIKAGTSYDNLERIDNEGAFYAIDYTGNYDGPLISKTLDLLGGGCSAFLTENENGDIITCRNYDFPHKDDEGNSSGLNLLVRCNPEGRYSSVGIADMALLSMVGMPYYAGALDSGKASKIPLMFAPYLCMDGINEKGLSASILALDTKDGEAAMNQNEEGKKSLMINALLRQILDNCASLDEAVKYVENVNVVSTFGHDFHLFVTDAAGNSAVFEWRYNDFTVTYTNAATNFYVGYDDGCDCYYGDVLKDRFVKAENVSWEYRYGYGHGYGRFKKLAETMEEHVTDRNTCIPSMTDEEVMDLLANVSQEYDPDLMTSQTQYSVIYNNTDPSATVCIMRDYENIYSFRIKPE